MGAVTFCSYRTLLAAWPRIWRACGQPDVRRGRSLGRSKVTRLNTHDMARTTYRIEHSKDGSDWRTFMAWSGLQKCRAEGAFGILMSMYDGVWYRLVEEGGQVIEVSHHAVPSVGKKAERVFTESEVRAMLIRVVDLLPKDYDERVDMVAVAHGIVL